MLVQQGYECCAIGSSWAQLQVAVQQTSKAQSKALYGPLGPRMGRSVMVVHMYIMFGGTCG